jgi:hypothetical protein
MLQRRVRESILLGLGLASARLVPAAQMQSLVQALREEVARRREPRPSPSGAARSTR